MNVRGETRGGHNYSRSPLLSPLFAFSLDAFSLTLCAYPLSCGVARCSLFEGCLRQCRSPTRFIQFSPAASAKSRCDVECLYRD